MANPNPSYSLPEKHTVSRGQRRRVYSEEITSNALFYKGKEALETLCDRMEKSQKDADRIKAADSFLKHTLLLAKDGYEYQEDELDNLLSKHGMTTEEVAKLKEEFRLASVVLLRDIASKIVGQRETAGSNMVAE
jgi:hypothetical protein